MSKNPEFDYIQFCFEGFKKDCPVLCKTDPESVALRIYEDASAFSGRYGRSNAGGGEDDIRCLIAAAAGVELEVFAAREIKDTMRNKLRKAWLENDHAAIFKFAFSFERSAAMAVIDLRDAAWADPYRINELDEEEGIAVPEVVEEWIETFCEPSQDRSVIGNRSRTRIRRKPAKRDVKSLFTGIA